MLSFKNNNDKGRNSFFNYLLKIVQEKNNKFHQRGSDRYVV